METIVRNPDGHVNEFQTVVKTIKHLVNTKAGFYTIAEIRAAINSQIQPHEYLTRKMIVHAIVKIASRKR